MKKIISITVLFLVLFAMVFSLSSCLLLLGSLSEDTGEENTADSITEPDRATTSDSGSPSTPTDDIEIVEQTLFDKDGVKVVAKSWDESSIFGDGIKLYIENNTDKNIGVGLDYLMVNGYMIGDLLFSAQVAAGKKTNETLIISEDDLEAAEITNIGHIELVMHVYDSESYMTLFDLGKAEIKTNLYDRRDGGATDGKVILEKSGVKVVFRKFETDPLWGESVVLYIESDKNATLSIENLTVNGYTITDLTSFTVLAGYRAVDSITILESELEKNDIKSIEKVEFSIHVYDPDTFNEIFTSDMLTCQN